MHTEKPKNRNTFMLVYKTDDGQTLEGQFTSKRLSIRDRAQIGVRKSQLTGGMYCVRDDDGNATGQGLDEDADYLNTMLAHLEIALAQKPSWFDLDDVYDLGLVREVYEKVVNFELTFFQPKDGEGVPGGSGPVREGDGSPEHSGSVDGHHPAPVVDKEVSASLDA